MTVKHPQDRLSSLGTLAIVGAVLDVVGVLILRQWMGPGSSVQFMLGWGLSSLGTAMALVALIAWGVKLGLEVSHRSS